jgi:hypothetical protein
VRPVEHTLADGRSPHGLPKSHHAIKQEAQSLEIERPALTHNKTNTRICIFKNDFWCR